MPIAAIRQSPGALAPPQRPHAVVVGSGFGGLAAAVRLGARGYRVTVLERLAIPGGRARVLEQDGFRFDAGPTIITAPFMFEELWCLAGRDFASEVDLRSLDPFYRIRFHDGATFDVCGDADVMRTKVARLAPGDADGYEHFMRFAEQIYRVGFERLGQVAFDTWTDMARIAPAMLRLRSYRTVYGLVASFVKNERLRFILSFHPLFVGGNPFKVTSIYGLIAFLERRHGVHFAMGGTGSLVRGLIGLIHAQGGDVRCNTEVASITLQGRRATGVRLVSGESLTAEVVVSNADAAWTHRHLLPEHVRRRWTNRRIDRARYSMGLFVWYFGTRRQYRDVPHHTILVGPRYRELLADIFIRHQLARDFSLYLHRPTATDPSLAPPGHDAFYVLAPVPHLDADVDWRVHAEPYRRSIEAFLATSVLPDLPRQVVTSRVMTPLDFRDDLLSVRGAAFGFEPRLSQSAWFRPHNRCEDVDGLFLVGAGTHPGAGVPGVLASARILDSLVPDAIALA